MVTPLKVTAANFSFFSVPSPYTELTAYIAAEMRSLSAGSENAFLSFLGVLATLGDDFRTRLTELLGAAGWRSGLMGLWVFVGVVVLDRADGDDLPRRELLLFRDDLAGETSVAGLANFTAPCWSE